MGFRYRKLEEKIKVNSYLLDTLYVKFLVSSKLYSPEPLMIFSSITVTTAQVILLKLKFPFLLIQP